MSTGQSVGGNTSAEVPSSQMTLKFVSCWQLKVTVTHLQEKVGQSTVAREAMETWKQLCEFLIDRKLKKLMIY